MIMRRLGEDITKETRAVAYQQVKVNRAARRRQILEILDSGPMTARQIAVELHRRGYTNNDERNNASPRLTELLELGLVELAGKTMCMYTGKTVTVFKKREAPCATNT